MTIILKFLLGAVLASGVVLWGGLPRILSAILVLVVGIVAAVWGDKFLLGFMSLMRYLR